MARLSDIGEVSFEMKTLEWLKIAAQGRLSPQVLHDLELRTSTEMMTGELVMQLRTRVLGERIDQEVFRDEAYWLTPKGRIDHLALAVEGRWIRTAIAGLALGGLVVAITASVIVGALLSIVAIALIALDLRPVEMIEHRKGIEVSSQKWATFPEQPRIYPKEMGPVVIQTIDSPRYYEGSRDV